MQKLVFALDFDKITPPAQPMVEAPQEVLDLATARQQARKDKNWAESDRLRDEIAKAGFKIKDTANGFELEKL